MKKKTDQQIADQFSAHINRFYETSTRQRNEIYLSYQYRDCNQQINPQGESQLNYQKNRPFTVVNMAAPIVRAVAGSEVMSANKIDYISIDPDFDAEADIISDAADWCQHESDYKSQRGIAAEDAATCGVGAIVTYLDMTQRDFIAGKPIVERIPPMFLYYDKSSRGGQINKKAKWCGYADPVTSETMDEYLEVNKPMKNKGEPIGAADPRDYILSYTYIENQEDIEFIYHYFWREFTDLYDVANPFIGERSPLSEAVLNDVTVANLIGAFAKDNGLNWEAAYWTLDKEAFGELKELIETIQLLLQDMRIPDLEYSKRNGRAFYRAEFARGQMLRRSLSYTQDGHALNFITGYYEESSGNYYGMMRPLSFIQDYLNLSMADLLDYTQTAVTGGDSYISTPAGKEEAIQRIASARKTTGRDIPVPEGTQVTPRAMPASAQHLSSVVNLLIEIMPRVLGLGQEFFGVVTKGDITDSMFGQVVKQSFNVLYNWKNASESADMHQARIFEDLIRLMAEANDGMILPILSPDNDGPAYMNLSQQGLARNYSIMAVERPMTADEKQKTFNDLMQIAPQALQAGVNLYPALTKAYPGDKQVRDELVQAATPPPPPPPPQPDPLNIATLEANIAYTNASAAKAQADADYKRFEMQRGAANAQTDEIQKIADIEETQAGTMLDKARAMESMAKAKGVEVDQSLSFMDRIDARMDSFLNGN